MIDYVSLMNRLFPKPDGEAPVTLRTATVTAIDADGTADINLSGVTVANVPVLGGAVFIVGTVVQVLSTRGSLLIIGGANAAKSSPVEQASLSGGEGTMGGTGFTNGLAGTVAPNTSVFGVAFIAPPSGRVAVFARSSVRHDTVSGLSSIDFEVKTGSTIGAGSGVWGPDDLRIATFRAAVAGAGSAISVTGLPTGLTPGGAYHADMVYKGSASGNSIFYKRHIMVIPQP
jgi:hypothetical protein